ncbi:Crp/Fnr family transcriptional regulator [Christensenellaceae bacterium OttesenSCG-928-M15]|nr:Crp/Fnr family transcriptional regulator [Christensenellaceae bacterium OttesenSCG-928-M15]
MQIFTKKQAIRYMDVLKCSALFCGLEDAVILAMAARPGVGCAKYAAHQTICSDETEPRAFGILLKGVAEVYKTSGTGELLVSRLGCGELYGVASIFQGMKERRVYPTRVVATKSVTALLISEEAIMLMFRQDERILKNYVSYLTDRIYYLNSKIDGLIRPNAKESLYHYLVQNAKGGKLALKMTALAQALNVSRATLYRALQALEDEGAIKKTGSIIEVTESRKNE